VGGAARADKKMPLPTWNITNIEFKGAEHFSADELQRHTNMAVGKNFDPEKAAEDCGAIVRLYQEHGYPFATCDFCTPHNFDFSFHMMSDVVYIITEGPKVKVRHVEFIGNTFVGADVLAE